MITATVNIPTQVSNHANLAAFPVTGALKTIYIAEDTNLEYRWTGSAYQVLGTAGSGVQSVTGDGVDNTDPLNPILTFPTPSEIGLGNVDNTSDANKPVSTAQATAIGLKEDAANKSTSQGDIASNVKFPVWSAVVTYVTSLGYLLSSTAASTYQAILTGTNFGTFLTGLTGKTSPVDADEFVISDSAASNVAKKVTGTNFKAYLKTYFDTIYTTTSAVATQITTALSGYLTSATAASTYAPIASPTFTGTSTTPAIIVSSETASRVAIIDASKNVKSADTATYPSLTELAYIKGLTSAIQTQLDNLNIFTLVGLNNGISPADATTYYGSFAQGVTFATATTTRTSLFSTALTLRKVVLHIVQVGNASSETVNLYWRNITAGTEVSIGTFTNDFGGNAGKTFVYDGLNIPVNNTYTYAYKMLTPTWVTNPTTVQYHLTFYFKS